MPLPWYGTAMSVVADDDLYSFKALATAMLSTS